MLVVDDDEGIRESVVEILTEEGFAAVGARYCVDALKFLIESRRKTALILLDLMMPVIDGRTFCRVRQEVSRLMKIPVVAISAGPMNGLQEELRVDATLPKPFDPKTLTAVATRMVSRQGAHDSRD